MTTRMNVRFVARGPACALPDEEHTAGMIEAAVGTDDGGRWLLTCACVWDVETLEGAAAEREPEKVITIRATISAPNLEALGNELAATTYLVRSGVLSHEGYFPGDGWRVTNERR